MTTPEDTPKGQYIESSRSVHYSSWMDKSVEITSLPKPLIEGELNPGDEAPDPSVEQEPAKTEPETSS